MPQFHNTININASPDKAWTVVGNLAAVNRWVPMLSDAKVEGTQRVCTLADGSGHMRESIRDYSNEKRSYAYTIIEGPLPAKNYRGSFAVMPHGKGSVVVWETDFDLLDPAQEDEVTRLFEGIYAQCLDSLKQLIEKS